MISLRTIQTSFTPTKDALFQNRVLLSKRKNSMLFFCKLKDSGSDSDSDSNTPPPEGDSRKQDLLARIAMLQAQKVRLTDYLDERSAYLTQFAEEANVEFDQIGENALKELDEAGARIMENIESRMQAFEESAESSKLEIEESQREMDEFEARIHNERNEGMFFKNLGQAKPVDDKVKAKEEAEKIKQVAKEYAGSESRRNIYLALIGLVTISLVDLVISPTSDWRKVAVLGVILVGLLSQFTYEQRMLSEREHKEAEKSQEDKK